MTHEIIEKTITVWEYDGERYSTYHEACAMCAKRELEFLIENNMPSNARDPVLGLIHDNKHTLLSILRTLTGENL